MSRSRLPYRTVGVLAAYTAAAGLAACGHSGPTTLHALVAAPSATVYPNYVGAPVRVDAVRLPAALDRIELLQETAPGSFRVREFDRWAAPPSRLARQALVGDLTLRLPAGSVVAPGAAGAATPTTAVSVDVLSFTPGPGQAALSAIWTRGCRPGDRVERAYLRVEAPASADTPETLSALVAQLADRIAAQLAVTPGPACG